MARLPAADSSSCSAWRCAFLGVPDQHSGWAATSTPWAATRHAARASGINVDAVKLFAYTVCGALAGLAGVVLAARITTGQPNAGVAYELDAIAAVVIGGTSLSGGVGGVGGTMLGALLMGVSTTASTC